MIYNIPTNQWVHDFVVSGPLPGTTTTTTIYVTAATTSAAAATSSTTVASPAPATSSSMGGVIGGAIGGLAVIAIVGFLFFRRHRSAKNDPLSIPSKDSDHDIFGRGSEDDDNYDDDKRYQDKYGVHLQETSRTGASESLYYSSASSTPFMNRFTPPPLHVFPDRSELQEGNAKPFGYYSVNKEGFSTPITSPDGAYTGTLHGHSPQFFPGGSNEHSLWFEGDQVDPRSPQQFGPGYGTSPAAWMAMMKAASPTNETRLSNRIANETPLSPQSPELAGFSRSGSYYPPPPGQQQPVQTEPKLMQKKLRLLKAQQGLDLERARLEQESQMQLIGGRLLHRG